MKALDFNIITILAIEDNEGAKKNERINDHILKYKTMKSSEKTTNIMVNKLNVHIIR